jgi:hypothetical protein
MRTEKDREKLEFNVVVDIDDIIWNIVSGLSYEDVVLFVKALDAEMADYEFTEEMHKYFSEQLNLNENDGE